MRKDEFKQGEAWAYRVRAQVGKPAKRVALVMLPNRKGLNKVKVCHLEGDLEGLEEFVSATHLLCRWKDWKKIERDEAKEATFFEYMSNQPELDQVVMKAATEIFAATGEDLMIDDYRNYSRIYNSQISGLERVADRAGLIDRPWASWPCIKTSKGHLYLPNSQLVDLAIAFAKVEPETVNLYLDKEEQEHVSQGYILGERYYHDELLKKKPSWALVRQWAGGQQVRDHLREEVKRLEKIARQAIYALKEAGAEREARRLERALEGK